MDDRLSENRSLVKKPWGWENRFAITDRYLGKVIHIKTGEMLSLQYHREKDEPIRITQGTMDLVLEDDTGKIQTHRLTQRMLRRIVPGRKHRMLAVDECEFFEVLVAGDRRRLAAEDKYGRQGTTVA